MTTSALLALADAVTDGRRNAGRAQADVHRTATFRPSSDHYGAAMHRRVLPLVLFAVAGCSRDSDVRQLDDYEVVVRDDFMSLIVTAERCGEIRVSTEETDAEIRLTVMQLQGDGCAGAQSRPVSLTRPLGDRTIVDQTTGDVITPS